jgi:hypothetical protein
MSGEAVSIVLSLREESVRCGVDVEYVERLVALGVIEERSVEQERPVVRDRAVVREPAVTSGFPPEVTLRVSRVLRLERDLGVNFEGAAVILDLLDRIDQLEHELRSLRGR